MAEEKGQEAVQSSNPPDEMEQLQSSFRRMWGWVLAGLVIIVGLALGVYFSEMVSPVPKIGIVRLYDVIDYYSAAGYFGALNLAATRSDVKAVVMLVDSPGGYAFVSEDLFYTITRLRASKPIVTSIEGIGASGSYYASAGTNYIYARPASIVGSIGVIASLPEVNPPDEDTLVTGPFKGSGSSITDFTRGVQVIKETFLGHVYDQRSFILENMHSPSWKDRLLPRESIATGQVWTGAEALDIGLVDALGSNRDAIQKAAELAGISNYQVIDLTYLFYYDDDTYLGYSADAEQHAEWFHSGPWVEFFHLYVMPEDRQ